MVRARATYKEITAHSRRTLLRTFLPISAWLPKYNWRKHLPLDIGAALVITLMAVPQAMSYANLAGLPSVFGLYGMVSPVIVYGCFGSSKQLGVGPVAVTSLLLGSGLANIYGSNANPNNPADPILQDKINKAAIQVGLIAGSLYTCVGVFGLEWIANFLSHSVISGFMTGSSVIIGLSQVKYILGIKMPRADTVPLNIQYINAAIGGFKWREFVMGMFWLSTILLARFVGTKYPKLAPLKSIGPIFVTILSLILMSTTNWEKDKLIAVVGKIPPGLPGETVSWWNVVDHGAEKLTLAILICCIDLCESLAIAKALAQKNRDEIHQRQEIVALGLANLVGSAFNCYTTTGSFSRSAVAQSMGAKSQLISLFIGSLMMIVLGALTPLLSHLPQNIQGAVVIAAVLPLLDIREGIYLFGVDLRDWLVWMVACLGTMFGGVEIGLALSVGLSVALVLFQVSFPNIVELGALENSRVYRSTKYFPEAKVQPGICIIRIDSSIIFANYAQLRQEIRTRIKANKDAIEAAVASGAQTLPVRIHTVILDLSAATYVDVSAVHLLRDFADELQAGGRRPASVRLLFANPSTHVLRVMMRGKFLGDKEPEHVFFLAVHEAVAWATANEMPLDVPVECHHLSLGFRSLGLNSEASPPEMKDPSVQAVRLSAANPPPVVSPHATTTIAVEELAEKLTERNSRPSRKSNEEVLVPLSENGE